MVDQRDNSEFEQIVNETLPRDETRHERIMIESATLLDSMFVLYHI